MDTLAPFTEQMKTRKGTVRERVLAFYEFITACDIQEKLDRSGKEFAKENAMDRAKEYEQIYPMVMDLFDKMTEVLGEEKVSLREFKELLEAGLSEVKIGIIPPSSDQVLVGDMERTRLKDIRVLFFVGVNDGKNSKRGRCRQDPVRFESGGFKGFLCCPGAHLPGESVHSEVLSVPEYDKAIR